LSKRSRTFLFCLLYGVLAFWLVYLLSSGGLGVSYDSENYLIMAERFIQGQWAKTFNPVWPPLYPLSIATIEYLGSTEPLTAARLVSIFAYVVLVVAVFLLGLQLKRRLTAHLGAISMLCLASVLYIYIFCWSETLYIMFSVLFFLPLTKFLQEPPAAKRTRYLLEAAVFAGLASVARYIGASLIAAGILSILLFGRYHPMFRRMKKTVLFTLVACTPLVLHFGACFVSYGLAGKTQFPSQYTFGHQLMQLVTTVYRDLLSYDLNFLGYLFLLRWEFLDFWLRIAFLLGALALVIMFVKSPGLLRREKNPLEPRIAILLYFLIYCSILLYVSSTVAIDPIASRFMAPLYPLILLLALGAFSNAYQTVKRTKAKNAALVSVIVCLAAFWAIQVSSTLNIYRGISSGSFPAMEQPGNLNRGSLRFLKENADSSDMIITNLPQKLSFICPRSIGYPDIPKDKWNSEQNDLTYEASRRSIYVLVCTGDVAPSGITLKQVEETDRELNLFAWRKDFGNDVIFKTKHVVFRKPSQPDSGK
jgi:4-amino-4-deoxy-L-arabinose transferase-like glycosyltransferase